MDTGERQARLTATLKLVEDKPVWGSLDLDAYADRVAGWHLIEPVWLEARSIDDLVLQARASPLFDELNSYEELVWRSAALLGTVADQIEILSEWIPGILLQAVLHRHSFSAMANLLKINERLHEPLWFMVIGHMINAHNSFPGEEHDKRSFIGVAEEEWERIQVAALIDPDDELRCVVPDVKALLHDVSTRITAQVLTAEDAIRNVDDSRSDGFEKTWALGLFLAFTGRASQAMPYLLQADKLRPQSPIVRYFYVDCAAAAGVTPVRTSAAFLGDASHYEVWEMPVFWDELAVHIHPPECPEDENDLYLIIRGIQVGLGEVNPISSDSGTSFPAVLSSPVEPDTLTLLRNIAEQTSKIQATQEHAHTAQQQTYTEVIAQSRRLERAIDREQWWADQFARLMPANRRQEIKRELRKMITSWATLSHVPQHQLISALYLMQDRGLADAEKVPAIIRAIGLAVESAARVAMPLLREHAGLRDIQAHADDTGYGTLQFRKSLYQLRLLRNDATHSPEQLTMQHAEKAWLLAVGCMDELTRPSE